MSAGDKNARAEAAAWLARLRSEDRTPEDERGFRAWLAESEAHRAAFEVTNAIFDMAGAADRRPADLRVSRRHLLRTGVGLAAASMAGLVVYLRSGTTYATEIGEQHKVSLEDGTLVSLDTDTEIHVSMNDTRRQAKLRRGRAHFDVAEDNVRPFHVIAGDQRISTPRGHFDVSRDGMVVSVLLEEGPVEVELENPGAGVPMPRTLAAGQLVVFAEDKVVREERPVMERAGAWRQGRLAFFGEPLSEAVAAMNRYTRRPIVILDPEIAQMPISGNYSVGDPQAFATSISVLLPVRVDMERTRITLRRTEENRA
ncbi:MAG TPA: FecR domain-containing protein [Steroidobacter sp.]